MSDKEIAILKLKERYPWLTELEIEKLCEAKQMHRHHIITELCQWHYEHAFKRDQMRMKLERFKQEHARQARSRSRSRDRSHDMER